MKKTVRILNSVSTRVILIIIALVLPLNIVSMIYMNNARNTIIEQAEFNSQKIADYKMQELNARMKNAQSLLSYFTTKDEDCIRIKVKNVDSYQYQESKMKFYYKLRNMAEMTDGADGYFYDYTGNKDAVIYGNADGGNAMVTHIKEMLSEYPEKKYPLGWHIYEWSGKKYLMFLTSETKMLYGCVIRLNTFPDEVHKSIEYTDTQVNLTEGMVNSNEKDQITVCSNVKNIYLNIEISRKEVLGKVSFAQRLLQSMTILYLILIPILYMILKKILIRPLGRVNYAHRQIEEGKGQYRIEDKTTAAEYMELYTSFNKMADNLNRLKIESYEKEISKQKMELRNLQLQIRPHFLLNTFNLIFTLSQRKENAMIQETVLYLSDYFRYIFRSEKELEIFTNELRLIKGYVKMASIRYFGRIEAEYDLDPEIDFIRMPPLLIHNFVENAVKYGVKQKEVLHIQITGRYENKTIIFDIRDDGNGMSPEMLKRNQKMFCGEFKPENQSEHLGLYNSLKRLKYFYGENAKIEVTSEQGKGTDFRISFPYDMEVEE